MDPATVLIIAAVSGGIVAAAWGVDRMARWAERRGWIYYRDENRPRGVNLGFLDQIYQPSMEHVIEQEIMEQTVADEDESGEGGE